MPPLVSLRLFLAAANDLGVLKRKPSELLRYHAWSTRTKAEYGPITKFVCNERLHWKPIHESPETGLVFEYKDPVPFKNPDDYKILLNDWPYGISPEISHIVVWSKVPIAVQKPEGYLTPESTALIEAFVQRTFIDRLYAIGIAEPQDCVLWFRNWTGLQSVRGLEHIHLFVRNVSQKLLKEWSGR